MERLQAIMKQYTLTPEEMHIVTGNFLRTEVLVTVYMLLCTLF
jgi:hypothetical protein